jgi:hypothetical protein
MNPWLFWAQLMVSFWTGMLHRPSARVYQIADYRPTNDNGTKKPPRDGRAA